MFRRARILLYFIFVQYLLLFVCIKCRRKRLLFREVFFAIKATTGFEPVITVLQTDALPLGYVAIFLNVSPFNLEDRGLEPRTDRL